MAQPTVDEFQALLAGDGIEEIVRDYVFGGEPFIFEDSVERYETFKSILSEALEVDRASITIVGSAKIGYSLSPDSFGKGYGGHSDVDVVIADEGLFDRVWFALLKWHYPWKYRLPKADWHWATRRYEDVYWGHISLSRIRQEAWPLRGELTELRDLAGIWFEAFKGLGREAQFSPYDFSGRLYRSWNHALQYHVDSLQRVRAKLTGE